MSKKICISIPVHERPDVIYDQIVNMKKFLGTQNVAFVLHISKSYKEPWLKLPFRKYHYENIENVFINPTSFPTQKGNLVHIHNSNFKFAKQEIPFDYFCLHASNDMYVRKGGDSYIQEKEYGIHQAPTSPEMPWKQAIHAHQDRDLLKMMRHLKIETIYGTQPEGIFFTSELFEEMQTVIDQFYSFENSTFYCREEIYYSTLIQKWVTKVHPPLLYSELCRKKVSEKLIEEINRGNLKEPETDHNGVGQYKLYDFSNLYAVKRVPRKYSHPLRRQIRSL